MSLPGLLLTLPWLVPPLGGPSPIMVPWVATVICLALALILVRWRDSSFRESVVPQAWLVAALLSLSFGLVQFFGLEGYVPFITTSPLGEAYGNLRQRNQLATLTAIGLGALLFLLLAKVRQASWTFRGLMMSMAALLGAGAAATASRTGLILWLLVFSLAAVWGWLRTPRVRWVAVAAGIAYLCAAWGLPELTDKGSGHDLYARLRDGGLPCGERWVLWRNVIHLIGLKPWTGWGWGELDYAHVMTAFPDERFCDLLDNAHNLPLHLAVEWGVPLAATLCTVILWGVLRAAPWREREPVRQLAWTVLAIIAVHSLLEYPLWYGPFQLAVLLCAVMLWSGRKQSDVSRRSAVGETSTDPVLAMQRSLGLALLLVAAYVAWDYHRISQIYLPPDQRSVLYRDDPMRHAQASWLFRRQVQFARYTLTPLTQDNAADLRVLGWELLHFSPEARVLEKLIEACVMLGRDDEALLLLQRYRAAYPKDYARWRNQPAT